MGHRKVALIQRPSVRWWQSQNQNLGVPATQQGFIPLHSFSSVQFSYSVMSDSVNLWIVAHQASLSTTNSWSLLKLMSIESVMPSKHLIFCRPLLLLPSIFPSIRVFSNESVLHIRWPKYRSFSFNISPSSEHSRLVSFRMDWLDSFLIEEETLVERWGHALLLFWAVASRLHLLHPAEWLGLRFSTLVLWSPLCLLSPNPHVEASSPNVPAFEDRALKEVITVKWVHEDGALIQ